MSPSDMTVRDKGQEFATPHMKIPQSETAAPARRASHALTLVAAVTALAWLHPAFAQSARTTKSSTTPQPPWRLVWRDEFAAPSIDTTKWTFDLGRGFYAAAESRFVSGWGNDELQCYTRDESNAYIRDGMLHLRAMRERADSGDRSACRFTSARLKTRDANHHALFAQRYGRFEFRAKLPTGQGLWSALWMLPQHDAYGTWAASGEIDVMEARGQHPQTVLGTLHYGGRAPANTHTEGRFTFAGGSTIADFHVYAIEWDPGRIRWLVDDVVWQTQDFWWSSSATAPLRTGTFGRTPTSIADLNAWPAPFDQPFYLVMNLAVGGRFLGNPDATTPFPAEMVVDYVRVYERRDGVGALLPRGAGKLPFPTR